MGDMEREKTIHLDRRSKSGDRARQELERRKRERTLVETTLKREKTFAQRAQDESMVNLASQLELEAKGTRITIIYMCSVAITLYKTLCFNNLDVELNNQRSSIVSQPAVPERENTEDAIKVGTDDAVETADPFKLMRYSHSKLF